MNSSCRWVVALLTLVVCGSVVVSGEECWDKNFKPVKKAGLSKSQIVSKYDRSVFKLRSGSSKGTGYLVDSQHGLVVTAAHVLAASIKEAGVPIRAHGKAFDRDLVEAKWPELEILEVGQDGIDVALLRFKEPALVGDIAPLDIAHYWPSLEEVFVSLSWGNDWARQSEPKAGDPEFHRRRNDGLLEFSEGSSGKVPGDSGAPLIDWTGAVIGTLKLREGQVVATYTPMYKSISMIEKRIKPSPRVLSLDSELRSGAASAADLLNDFLPFEQSPRNIELIAWAKMINDDADKYTGLGDRFECPIVPAYWERNLSKYALTFSRFISHATLGRLQLRGAVAVTRAGDIDQTRALLVASIQSLGDGIDERLHSNPSSLGYVACQTASIDPVEERRVRFIHPDGGAAEYVVNRCPPKGDNVASNLFRDHALANLQLSRLASGGERATLVEAAGSSGQMAVLLADSGQLQASNFALLGDVLFASAEVARQSGNSDNARQDLDTATRAFAASYAGGSQVGWVEGNWRATLERIKRLFGDSQAELIERGIEGSPILAARQLSPAGLSVQ